MKTRGHQVTSEKKRKGGGGVRSKRERERQRETERGTERQREVGGRGRVGKANEKNDGDT